MTIPLYGGSVVLYIPPVVIFLYALVALLVFSRQLVWESMRVVRKETYFDPAEITVWSLMIGIVWLPLLLWFVLRYLLQLPAVWGMFTANLLVSIKEDWIRERCPVCSQKLQRTYWVNWEGTWKRLAYCPRLTETCTDLSEEWVTYWKREQEYLLIMLLWTHHLKEESKVVHRLMDGTMINPDEY